jgi:glycosyltransferase involved in cell wall biosynthesis
MYKVLQLATQSATSYRFALPIAKYLQKNGYQVSLGCSLEAQPDVPSFTKELEAEEFPLLPVPIPRSVHPSKDLKAIWALYKILKKEKFDFIHTHNSKAGIIGRIAAFLAGVPYRIHTNHGLPFFKVDKFSFVQSCMNWTIEFVAARLSHRILTVSPTEFDKAKRFLIARPPNLVEIGQGINPEFYSQASVSHPLRDQRVREVQEKFHGKAIIGGIARLVSEKGFDVLIEAAAVCKKQGLSFGVVIVGDGPERERLVALVEKLGLQDDVHFLGAVSEMEVIPECYSIMDIFVLPTRWESFGIVFAEAMSMEVAVIAPDKAPMNHVVSDQTALLVEPDSIESFASAITQLLEDSELRKQLGQAGRKRVLELWDEEKMLGRIEQQYQALIRT